jgi:hypothetical protein
VSPRNEAKDKFSAREASASPEENKMPDSYTNLLHHIVFSTKDRRPIITPDHEVRLYDYIGGTIRAVGGIWLELTAAWLWNVHSESVKCRRTTRVHWPPERAPSEGFVSRRVHSILKGQTELNTTSEALLQKSAKPTNDNSPPIHRWGGDSDFK